MSEAAAGDAEAGYALQRARNIAFASARDVGRREDRHDLGGRADDIGGIAAGDAAFGVGAAGDRHLDLFADGRVRRDIVGRAAGRRLGGLGTAVATLG